MKQILFAFFILTLLTGILYIVKTKPEILHKNLSNIFSTQHNPTITIDGQTFNLLLAKTQQEQEKGLGYRASLPQDQGMLFPFEPPVIQEFWMKGMQFSLDIIYIKNNYIINIFDSVPDPTAKNPLIHTVEPTQPADNVLEINAGLAKKYDFKVGDKVEISNI